MRVFAISDLHVDYEQNARWVDALSLSDYQADTLIVAGDVSDRLDRLHRCLTTLTQRFRHVVFVAGNHDLWTLRDHASLDSLAKYEQVRAAATACGASVDVLRLSGVHIVPLQSWYDYSFGAPNDSLRAAWMDFRACRWPDEHWTAPDIARHFTRLNTYRRESPNDIIVSCSHFLPRIDVMPDRIPPDKRFIYPVLGSDALGAQVRELAPQIHVYGHSHVNRRVTLDGTLYVNNAFAYPHETRIAAKALQCVLEV